MRDSTQNKMEVPLELERELAALRKRSLWRQLLDRFFGYDFFISYRWSDGKNYAISLAKALQECGYECFLDSKSYTAGDNWKVAGAAAIRRTSRLVLIGSPEVVDSGPVLREVQIFSRSGRKVIPIGFDGSLDSDRIRGYPIGKFIDADLLQIREPAASLNQGPTSAALDALQKAFHSRRQSVKRLRALQAISAVLFFLFVGALGAAWYAQRQRAIAESGQLAAESLLSADVNSASSLGMAVHSVHRFRTEQGEVALDSALSLPQARVILNHEGAVNSVAFSPDGKRLLTSSDDQTARIWDTNTGRELVRLVGHTGKVISAKFSPDGTRIVTASEDKTARVWDTATGHALATLAGHEEKVLSAAFLFDSQRVVSITGGGFRRWDVVGGSWQLGSATGARALLSPDGRTVLVVGDDHIAGVADADAKRPPRIFGDGSGDFDIAVFSPDGKRVLTNKRGEVEVTRVWDAGDGHLLSTLSDHRALILAAAFSEDGKRIVTAGNFDGLGRVFDADSGNLIATLVGHKDQILYVAFSPDGDRVLTASDDHTARLWDAYSGRPISTFAGHEGPVQAAVFSPDGRRVVTVSEDKTARIWDTDGPRAHVILRGGGAVDAAMFSPDGKRVLTTGDPPQLWEAHTGRPLVTLSGQSADSVAFSPDGRRIVTASLDHNAVIWDSTNGQVLSTLTGHTDAVMTARFSMDGRRVVTASSDMTARVWDAGGGSALATLTGHRGQVAAASFSPDGKRVLTASNDTTARVWDAADGRPLATLSGHHDKITDAEFSPDGNQIVTASGDGTAKVWDARSWRLLVTLSGHREQIWTAAFSPNGKQVVTGSVDQTARVWDAASGQSLVMLVGHHAPVRTAAFSLDGRRVVTASEDATARVWDAESGHLLAVLGGHEDNVNTAAFSPDGRRVLTASDDHTARIFVVDLDGMMSQAMNLLSKELR